MDFRLELVGVLVSDVDRAKDFYVDQAGLARGGSGDVGKAGPA
jgi:catechol 2,3-dioxygenase-like lactoylglutathione lyase family enzyme